LAFTDYPDASIRQVLDGARELQSLSDAVNAVTVSDFLDLAGYHGKAGDRINIGTSDGKLVALVSVLIRDADGNLIEKGEATRSNWLKWHYTARVDLPTTKATVIITATDLPGNTTEMSLEKDLTADEAEISLEEKLANSMAGISPEEEPAEQTAGTSLEEEADSDDAESSMEGESDADTTETNPDNDPDGIDMETSPDEGLDVEA